MRRRRYSYTRVRSRLEWEEYTGAANATGIGRQDHDDDGVDYVDYDEDGANDDDDIDCGNDYDDDGYGDDIEENNTSETDIAL